MDFEVKSQATIMVNQDKPEGKNEVILPSPEPGTTKENKNKFDIYLGLAWIPLLPIYGENESFGENMSSYGAGLRLAVLSAKQKLLNLGMEGCSSWLVSTGDQPVQSLTFDLNFVLRFSDDKGILNSKTGAGVSMRSGISPIPADSQYAFHANFGVSLIFWLSMRLYLELGMEYVQFFTDSGFLRPSVGLEYRF